MGKRHGLTDRQVAALKRKTKRYTLPDPEQIGHYLRIPPKSSKAAIAFAAVARDTNGKQIWTTVGTTDAMGIEQARELAREAIRRIKAGRPTSEPANATVRAVAEQWLERHVRKNGFRTARESGRIVNKYILPEIGDRPIADVRRIHIAKLLDRIEDESGAPMADSVLKTFRAISRWFQQRDEGYHPPLTAGMTRVPRGEGRRKRILSDDELRKLWNTGAASHAGAAYAAFVKLALLTAQRREKLRDLRWDDIGPNGVWTIRTEAREKGNPGKLKLPQTALDVINARPRFIGNPHVFAGRNGRAAATLFSGTYKVDFDKLSGVSNWRIHDLRRTARSLMSRAGVQTEIAERILGHARDELIATYDQYDYATEMATALEKLAALIDRIVNAQAALQEQSAGPCRFLDKIDSVISSNRRA
jgi:integrase